MWLKIGQLVPLDFYVGVDELFFVGIFVTLGWILY